MFQACGPLPLLPCNFYAWHIGIGGFADCLPVLLLGKAPISGLRTGMRMRRAASLMAGLMWFDPLRPDALSHIRHDAQERDGELSGESTPPFPSLTVSLQQILLWAGVGHSCCHTAANVSMRCTTSATGAGA